MMYCMSVSHKKAPVNLREQFAFGPYHFREQFLEAMRWWAGLRMR